MKKELFFASAAVALIAWASNAGEIAPSLPTIPGITAEDRFLQACVDCHIVVPDSGMDDRLSTKLRAEQFNPAVLARIRAVLPDPIRITGRHPRLPDPIFRNLPAGCLTCHRDNQTNLPPLAPMIYAIYLTGESENRYLIRFGGQCTNCHKFNTTNGRWSIPSGQEK